MTNRPICLVILGMHRSGTSAITGAASLLGGALPDNLIGAYASNPKGHFEPFDVVRTNAALLKTMGRHWHDWRRIEADRWTDAARVAAAAEVAAAMRTAIGGAQFSLIKDPRISLLLPAWRAGAEQAGVDARYLIPIRRPEQVADSLARRNGWSTEYSLCLWMRYLIDAERDSRGAPRAFINAAEFVSDPTCALTRAGEVLNLNWPKNPAELTEELSGFVEKRLLGNAKMPDSVFNAITNDAYAAHGALLNNPDCASAQRAMDELSARFEREAPSLMRAHACRNPWQTVRGFIGRNVLPAIPRRLLTISEALARKIGVVPAHN